MLECYECYEFEECEYNGQPKCYLPDGMECPHGVKAHKPTNADCIRAMSDEELAKSRVIDYEEYPGAYLAIDCEKVFYSEEEAIAAELEWLQQPAEEDT